MVPHCACWWCADGNTRGRITGVVRELGETSMSSPGLFNICEQVLLIQKMHDGKFMTGKHEQIKWAMSHQLLRLHRSPKWALLRGSPYKAVHFATPDMVLPHARPCGGGCTQRDPHHPLCLRCSFLSSSLQCQSSRSAPLWWANCLGGCAPNQICHSACFKTTEKDVSFLAFFKKQTIPQLWFGVQPLNWHDQGEVTPIKQGRNPLTLLCF